MSLSFGSPGGQEYDSGVVPGSLFAVVRSRFCVDISWIQNILSSLPTEPERRQFLDSLTLDSLGLVVSGIGIHHMIDGRVHAPQVVPCHIEAVSIESMDADVNVATGFQTHTPVVQITAPDVGPQWPTENSLINKIRAYSEKRPPSYEQLRAGPAPDGYYWYCLLCPDNKRHFDKTSDLRVHLRPATEKNKVRTGHHDYSAKDVDEVFKQHEYFRFFGPYKRQDMIDMNYRVRGPNRKTTRRKASRSKVADSEIPDMPTPAAGQTGLLIAEGFMPDRPDTDESSRYDYSKTASGTPLLAPRAGIALSASQPSLMPDDEFTFMGSCRPITPPCVAEGTNNELQHGPIVDLANSVESFTGIGSDLNEKASEEPVSDGRSILSGSAGDPAQFWQQRRARPVCTEATTELFELYLTGYAENDGYSPSFTAGQFLPRGDPFCGFMPGDTNETII